MVSAGSIIRGSFDFVREKPGVVAVWAVVYMVGSLITSLISTPLYRAQFQAAMGEPLPPHFLTSLAMVYVVMITMFTAIFAATFRAILHPDQSRGAYLRLGMDELRLLGLILLLILIGFLSMLLIGFVAGIGAVGLGIALGQTVTVVAVLLLYAAIFCVYIWAWVRISVAGPLTILRGTIELRTAWRLTKGHFWALSGGYFVIAVTIFAVFVLFLGATAGPYFIAMFNAANDPIETMRIADEQMQTMAPGSPLWFVMLIAGGALAGVAIALQGAMTAIATRELLTEVVE